MFIFVLCKKKDFSCILCCNLSSADAVITNSSYKWVRNRILSVTFTTQQIATRLSLDLIKFTLLLKTAASESFSNCVGSRGASIFCCKIQNCFFLQCNCPLMRKMRSTITFSRRHTNTFSAYTEVAEKQNIIQTNILVKKRFD